MKSVQVVVFLLIQMGTCWSQDSLRLFDPIELTGSDLYELLGADPASIMGFKFQPDSFEEPWLQIPIQVDEMHIVEWQKINPGDCRLIGRKHSELMYADAKTYSGIDEDPTFDFDDELVIMAKDLGPIKAKAAMSFPPLVKQDVMIEVAIADPIKDGEIFGFAYLFISEKGHNGQYQLKQDSGQQRITYKFNLTKQDPESGSNDYLDVYKFNCDDDSIDHNECSDLIMNPEDTWFKSSTYSRHFSENWFSDEVITTPAAAGDTDDHSNGNGFWGMEDFQFNLNSCERSTKSFTKGPTAFVANIQGPLRAIRSWIGANSGTITQRTSKMYEQREDQTTFIRVHPIPGMFDYINFQEGVDLSYYNCHNTEGFKVDGSMDSSEKNFNATFCNWEMVQGSGVTFFRAIDPYYTAPGSKVNTFEDVFESWYYDDNHPIDMTENGAPVFENNWSLCSALMDNQMSAWGTMGFKLRDDYPGFANSDPLRIFNAELEPEACEVPQETKLSYLRMTTKQYYLSADFSVNSAAPLALRALSPLYRRVRC